MSKVMNFVPRSLLIFSALFLIGVIWIAEATAQKVRVAMPAKSSVERLSDWIQDTVQGVVGNRFLKPAQHQLAVRATETLGCKDKHAQARAADIIELCNIDDETAVARIYSGQNFLLKRFRCRSVQFSRQA